MLQGPRTTHPTRTPGVRPAWPGGQAGRIAGHHGKPGSLTMMPMVTATAARSCIKYIRYACISGRVLKLYTAFTLERTIVKVYALSDNALHDVSQHNTVACQGRTLEEGYDLHTNQGSLAPQAGRRRIVYINFVNCHSGSCTSSVLACILRAAAFTGHHGHPTSKPVHLA